MPSFSTPKHIRTPFTIWINILLRKWIQKTRISKCVCVGIATAAKTWLFVNVKCKWCEMYGRAIGMNSSLFCVCVFVCFFVVFCVFETHASLEQHFVDDDCAENSRNCWNKEKHIRRQLVPYTCVISLFIVWI